MLRGDPYGVQCQVALDYFLTGNTTRKFFPELEDSFPTDFQNIETVSAFVSIKIKQS